MGAFRAQRAGRCRDTSSRARGWEWGCCAPRCAPRGAPRASGGRWRQRRRVRSGGGGQRERGGKKGRGGARKGGRGGGGRALHHEAMAAPPWHHPEAYIVGEGSGSTIWCLRPPASVCAEVRSGGALSVCLSVSLSVSPQDLWTLLSREWRGKDETPAGVRGAAGLGLLQPVLR